MKPLNIHSFRRVRRAGVPLSFYETPDPAATIKGCCAELNGDATAPLLAWDIASGLVPLNEAGKAYCARAQELQGVSDPVSVLKYLTANPPMSEGQGDEPARPGVVYAHNFHRFLEDVAVLQSVWNCRDTWKATGVSLVMLGSSARIPAELKSDIPIFSEPVPDEAAINGIIDGVTKDAGIKSDEFDRGKVVDGLLGYLSAFAVEQALSLSLKVKKEGGGIDVDQLWSLKVAALKNTAGLEITLPKVNFSDLTGTEGAKRLITRYLNGRKKPRAVLWLDEIQRMVAGGAGDLSGTSQAMIEQFLFWTQAKEVDGLLLIGIPGSGKSRTVECTAGEAQCPCLRASMSTVKGSLVGQSEAQMKTMLASVDAVGQGRVLMLATANSIDELPPELMARFKLGVFVYDYPSREESKALWTYYLKKYGLKGQEIPPSQNWVGREIASCCERAWIFNCTLAEAAESVVPICTANAGKMDALRRSVSGRFLSAAKPGLFEVETAATMTGRKVNL